MNDSAWENVQNVNNQECWQAGRPHTNRVGMVEVGGGGSSGNPFVSGCLESGL